MATWTQEEDINLCIAYMVLAQSADPRNYEVPLFELVRLSFRQSDAGVCRHTINSLKEHWDNISRDCEIFPLCVREMISASPPAIIADGDHICLAHDNFLLDMGRSFTFLHYWKTLRQ